MIRWKRFVQYQKGRATFRAVIFWTAIRSATFWVVLLGGLAWLQSWGLVPLAWLILVAWLLFALPTLIIECAIFADVVNYALTGRGHILPRFETIKKTYGNDPAQVLDGLRQVSTALYWYARISEALSTTSPLTPLALWGMLVLYRLPSKAYGPEGPTPILSFPRKVREAETFLLASMLRERAAGTS